MKEISIKSFDFYISIFLIAYYKWQSKKNVTINYIDNGRPSMKFNEIVGPFINNILLIESVNAMETISEFSNKISQRIKEHSMHRLYPYDIVRKIVSKELDKNFISEVVFVYQNMIQTSLKLDGLNLSVKYLQSKDNYSNIKVEVVPGTKLSILNINYNSSLYDKKEISRLGNIYKSLLYGELAVNQTVFDTGKEIKFNF